MQKQVPSVGRIVHLQVGLAGEERAAIITTVDEPGKWDSRVSLALLREDGITFLTGIPLAPDEYDYGYAWPPHVPSVEV